MASIYEEFTQNERSILKELLNNKLSSHLYFGNNYIDSAQFDWAAIFEPYLTKIDKKLALRSERYYYRTDDMNRYYPTNPQSTNIAPPFSSGAPQAELEINFIDTTTGTKIYDYVTELCKAQETHYKDLKHLAVSLTEHKNHKVRVIVSERTAWILSNEFSNKFVQNCLALFPFIFDIKELQENAEIIQCCQAVTKEQSIKQFFTKSFKEIEKIRQAKKLMVIKDALNAGIKQQIDDLDYDIRRKESNITDLENRLYDGYKRIQVLRATKLGFENQEGASLDQVNEILDFVKNNQYTESLELFEYGGYTYLQLDLRAPIMIYESEPLEKTIESRLSDPYRTDSYKYVLRALKRIFIEEELQMFCQTMVRIKVSSADFTGNKDPNNMAYKDYKLMPHPHLVAFNCWGDNKNNIQKALRETDILTAFTMMIVAAENINFTDATVLNRWLENIMNMSSLYNVKCCKSKADGQMWSISDIVEQLKREDEANPPQEEEIGHPELEDTIPF